MSGEKFRDETREEMNAWLLEQYGPRALDIANRFIDYVGEHPYEIAAKVHREIRGIRNQHSLPRRSEM